MALRTLRTLRLSAVHDAIISCERCPRLRRYCAEIARTKRRAYRDEVYWGRPVPGFGDPGARVLLVGLAPAAHGANRTGRVFTGDGPGGSGDFLMGALHRAGFANIPTAQHLNDGLALADAFITAAVRCAPPDNKPAPDEIAACLTHLDAEIAALPRIQVVVALGKIGFDAYLQLLKRRGAIVKPRPAFGHAAVHALPNGQTLIGCYHPSRQNTNTGKLTARMMDDVFRLARRALRNRVTSSGMTTLSDIDTTVQELRLEQHRSAFTQHLARIVTAFGAIPDWPPNAVTAAELARLRELADETVDAIERRIDSGADDLAVQQQLAGTIYELRKRMEAVDVWFHHFASARD
jgi:uracil-DNA glycosylase family 4